MSTAAFNSLCKFRCYFNVNQETFFRCKSSVSHAAFNSNFRKNIHKHRKTPFFKGEQLQFPSKVFKHHKRPLFESVKLQLGPKVKEKPKQKFDYFLVLDFEATCDSPVNLDPQEIIEFPVLKVNADTLKVESTFHSYVRPVIYPELSSFCTELTGIIQGMVDTQPVFKDVFKNFFSWLEKEQLLENGVTFAFVTCGDPDLEFFLPVQCIVSEIQVPEFMKQWINIKRSFCEVSPYTWPDNLPHMLKYCDLKPYGELHSGVDDAINIANILVDLAERGLVFDFNGWRNT